MNEQEMIRIQNQFGGFCAKVLKNEVRTIYRKLSRLLECETSLAALTMEEQTQAAREDQYFADESIFVVLGLPVVVKGDLLVDALRQLPARWRDVVLLYYFVGMTDREIDAEIHLTHQAITKRRNKALLQMREYLRKEGYNEWPGH